MQFLKVELTEPEGRMVVTRGWGGEEDGWMSVRVYKLLVLKSISPGDLMYSMIIVYRL